MTTCTLRKFADRLGVKPSYVTKLKQAGRLVLTPAGRVDVEASQKRIAETQDPNRDDVRRRHAEARKAAEAEKGAQDDPGEDVGGEDNSEAEGDTNSATYTRSRAMKEQYFALTAKLEYERASGKLVETEAVKRAGEEAGTALRVVLENLPDQLAPLLAPVTDEAKVHALLVENIEIILLEISGKLEAAGKGLVEVKV